jgi:hypothetical protein
MVTDSSSIWYHTSNMPQLLNRTVDVLADNLAHQLAKKTLVPPTSSLGDTPTASPQQGSRDVYVCVCV